MAQTAHLRLVKQAQPPPPVETLTELELSMAEYLTAARQEGLSASTIKTYSWQLGRLAGWLMERRVVEPRQLLRPLLREWGASLWEKWQAPSICQAVSTARSWLKYLYKEHVLGEDFSDCLKIPKVKKRIQRTLTAAEIELLLSACADTAMGRRNAALVSLLTDSGLRAAEVCRLRWKDLDLSSKRLVVIVKGGNQEPGHYGPETVERLLAWKQDWQERKGEAVETVFISIQGRTPGQTLTKGGLQRILHNLGKAVGLEGVTTHAFRRAFACLLIEQGAPNRLVQSFGRWEDEKMIKRYTSGLNAGELYQQYSPISYLKRVKSD